MSTKKISNLARLREITGLSQSAFAQLCDRSVHTVQAIEQGKLQVGVELAKRISFTTGVSADWLLSNSEDLPTIGVGDEIGQPYTREIFEKVRSQALSWERAHPQMEEYFNRFIIDKMAFDLCPIFEAANRTPHGFPLLMNDIEAFIRECARKYGTEYNIKAMEGAFWELENSVTTMGYIARKKGIKSLPSTEDRIDRAKEVLSHAESKLSSLGGRTEREKVKMPLRLFWQRSLEYDEPQK